MCLLPPLFLLSLMVSPENENADFAGERIQDANSRLISQQSPHVTPGPHPGGELIKSPPKRRQAGKDPRVAMQHLLKTLLILRPK